MAARPERYGFPAYVTTLTALLALPRADRVSWVGTDGRTAGMVMARPETPVTRLVVNDVGPTIEPARLRASDRM
jgi:hypothetical protein